MGKEFDGAGNEQEEIEDISELTSRVTTLENTGGNVTIEHLPNNIPDNKLANGAKFLKNDADATISTSTGAKLILSSKSTDPSHGPQLELVRKNLDDTTRVSSSIVQNDNELSFVSKDHTKFLFNEDLHLVRPDGESAPKFYINNAQLGSSHLSDGTTITGNISALQTQQALNISAIASNTARTSNLTANKLLISSASGTINTASIGESDITALQTQQGTNTSAIATNAGDITTVKTNISSLQTTQGAQGTNITNNSTNINTITGEISTLQTTQNSQGTSITTNTTNIGTNTGKISALETQQATNTSAIATNAGDITTVKTNISSLQTTQGAQGTSITTNTTNIATNTGNISALQTQQGTNTSAIATNTTDLTTAKTNITSLQTTQASQGTSITTNTTDLTTAKTNITNLQTTQASQGTSITTNTTNIATNTGNISALQTQQGNASALTSGTLPNARLNSNLFSEGLRIWWNAVGYSAESSLFSTYTYGHIAKSSFIPNTDQNIKEGHSSASGNSTSELHTIYTRDTNHNQPIQTTLEGRWGKIGAIVDGAVTDNLDTTVKANKRNSTEINSNLQGIGSFIGVNNHRIPSSGMVFLQGLINIHDFTTPTTLPNGTTSAAPSSNYTVFPPNQKRTHFIGVRVDSTDIEHQLWVNGKWEGTWFNSIAHNNRVLKVNGQYLTYFLSAYNTKSSGYATFRIRFTYLGNVS